MPKTRKRGCKPEAPLSTNVNNTSSSSSSSTQNDILLSIPTDPSSPVRGRPRKLAKHQPDRTITYNSTNTNDVERSRHADANDITILPARWDSVAEKAVPAMEAAVKVFCAHTKPNFSLAWQRKRQYSSSSSGFIVGGRRVLTNAHSVEHHTQVKLKKRGSDAKYLATVLSVGTECDIGIFEASCSCVHCSFVFNTWQVDW